MLSGKSVEDDISTGISREIEEDVPWCTVCKRSNVDVHGEHGESEHGDDDGCFDTVIGVGLFPRASNRRSPGRNRSVDCLRQDEAENRAGYEGGCQVRREVVVNEELTAHEVEGEVVNCPNDEEETSGVPETITDI